MDQATGIDPGAGRVSVDQRGEDGELVPLPGRRDLDAGRIAALGRRQAIGLDTNRDSRFEAGQHLAHEFPELIVAEELAPGKLLALPAVEFGVAHGAQGVAGENDPTPEGSGHRAVLLDEEPHPAGC